MMNLLTTKHLFYVTKGNIYVKELDGIHIVANR